MYVCVSSDDNGEHKFDDRGEVTAGVIHGDATTQANRKRKHNSIKRFQCSQCEAAFTLEKNLYRHVRTVHNKVFFIFALLQLTLYQNSSV